MSARVVVDMDSAVPPFEQVRSQLARFIQEGRLSAGTQLPTVRALAGDLGLASGTVARAYKELEAAGLIDTARRGGSTVRPLTAHAARDTAASSVSTSNQTSPATASSPTQPTTSAAPEAELNAAVVHLVKSAAEQQLSLGELLSRVVSEAAGKLRP